MFIEVASEIAACPSSDSEDICGSSSAQSTKDKLQCPKIEEAGDPRNRLPLAQLVLTVGWGQVRARSICPPSNFLQEILHQIQENCRAGDLISLELSRGLRLADKTAIMTVYCRI